MTIQKWLAGAIVHDLSGHRGNGPFGNHGPFLGVILHVNEAETGTSDAFFENNSGEVTPNFQVFKSAAAGGIHQFLPFDWQPWCQIDGNFQYAAIETAGLHSESLTAYQESAIESILRIYHAQMGMSLIVANSPGQKGFGTHQMGGAAWGGHPCPGTIRQAQRQAILNAITGTPPPVTHHSPHHGAPWPINYMKSGDYFGLESGPAQSHGGAAAWDRTYVKEIQDQLLYLGYVPGNRYPSSAWADGVFEQPTKDAVTRFQKAHLPHSTTLWGEVWEPDWKTLMSL